MTDSDETPEDNRASINLKIPQAPVSRCEPWNDDVLQRSQLGATLTNIAKTQSGPLTISIHGYWGTGKTFLLQRWQRELQTQKVQALYFNAWEDDFCDDPLLAILGQLAEHFKESDLNCLASAVIDIAVPLLRQTALTLVKATTGLSLDLQQNQSPTLLDLYLDHRKSKDDLKEHLARLADAVHDETGYPLVFIIDELDRCRPTFAIELLEKVKHIFDIKHMVFVFGLNRRELSISLRSIYGDIDSDVYLRRFFDIEFTLPEINGALYCKHVMDQYGLQDYFATLSSEANSRVHNDTYRLLYDTFPEIWSRFSLSLRDIEHCVALIALVARNVRTGHPVYPAVLGLLIPIKLKNSDLYQSFVRQESLASEVINYADSLLSSEPISASEIRVFDWIEAHLYFAENPRGDDLETPQSAIAQLRLLAEGKELTSPKYLSERTKTADGSRISSMVGVMETASRGYWHGREIVRYIASLVDLHQDIPSR